MEWLKTRGCAETVSSRAVERVPRSYLDTWIHLRERIIRGLEAVLTLVAWRAALRSISGVGIQNENITHACGQDQSKPYSPEPLPAVTVLKLFPEDCRFAVPPALEAVRSA